MNCQQNSSITIDIGTMFHWVNYSRTVVDFAHKVASVFSIAEGPVSSTFSCF